VPAGYREMNPNFNPGRIYDAVTKFGEDLTLEHLIEATSFSRIIPVTALTFYPFYRMFKQNAQDGVQADWNKFLRTVRDYGFNVPYKNALLEIPDLSIVTRGCNITGRLHMGK